ncbi:MAG: hypothetical protein ACFFCS_05230 [Candidatus Hodarchaeota archaeon]
MNLVLNLIFPRAVNAPQDADRLVEELPGGHAEHLAAVRVHARGDERVEHFKVLLGKEQ